VAEFVLVHGTTQSPAGWDRLAGALGARGHTVTVIDLPTDRADWTVADYAREAAGQAGEPAGRRVVAGHSGAGVLHPPGPLSPEIIRACIVPAGDRTLRPGWLRQAARERLGAEPVDVDAGHCPHVSQPETIAGILAQI
jgi:pimeloyl-ACP methyl ester carboxylesterase